MIATLSMKVPPRWAEFDAVRDRSLEFLRRNDVATDPCIAVAMVVSELVENAAKYGTFRRGSDAIEIAVTLAHTVITIEICNPLGPNQTCHVTRLDGMIQWIRGFQDPFEAYLERLKEVSAQTLDSSESGLGLVRIAYEGQAVLDFFVREQNILAVSAVHRL
ncbi:MAG: ATP-binding protein [Myxococcaceae bacterium]|nr:ATP-binding protein [Myxococcaceae bacterium]